jgi:hypothetical protein
MMPPSCGLRAVAMIPSSGSSISSAAASNRWLSVLGTAITFSGSNQGSLSKGAPAVLG